MEEEISVKEYEYEYVLTRPSETIEWTRHSYVTLSYRIKNKI
jgi:hypothetical protein